MENKVSLKKHQLYTNSSHYSDSFIGHASCTRLTREFVWYLTKNPLFSEL